MPPFRVRSIPVCAAALIATTVLTGCTMSRLSSQPPPGVQLAGDWKLDPDRSDDLGKAVAQLRAQAALARKHMGGQQQGFGGYGGRGSMGGAPGGQQGGDSGAGGDDSGPEGGGPAFSLGPGPRSSPVNELMSNVPQGDYLRIGVSANSFTVAAGNSSNEYTPGLESDVSAEQGDAQQFSGWKGSDYVVDTKPQFGPEIIQTYSLAKDGSLTLTVRLTGGRINFTFARVYRRTSSVAPLAPPTTG